MNPPAMAAWQRMMISGSSRDGAAHVFGIQNPYTEGLNYAILQVNLEKEYFGKRKQCILCLYGTAQNRRLSDYPLFANPSVQKHSKKAKISWIQSFLAGVPFIVVGYRDDSSRLVRTERLRTKDMTHRVKMKNY
ncbi:hypothetical protein LXL04_023965 [Taraxacum kok-saghyz]